MKKVKLLDTGQKNQTIAVVLHVDPKERKRRYSKEYYKRPEVIARRKTPENRARKALYDRDRLRNKKKLVSSRNNQKDNKNRSHTK